MFNEYILKLKSGYFDEKFEELELNEICKRVGIDKKDIDEIVKKTKFKIEGAVYYKDKARFFVKGEKDKIGIKVFELSLISKFIHSHPKGTSFSIKDIELMLENKISQIVAFNDEYFYSLKIEDFEIEFADEFVKIYNLYDKILTDKVQRGKITESQKKFSINHKIWKKLFNKQGAKYEYFRIRKKT